jgi:hypothetical protein
VRRWDRCGSVNGAMGWLGLARLAGHEFRERETEQRERNRATINWGWLGVARDGEKVQRAESESREKRVRAERREVVEALACFGLGKWFTEIFSVNRFPFFPSRFYGQKQRFSV